MHAWGWDVIFRITNGSAFFCTEDIYPKCKWFYMDFKTVIILHNATSNSWVNGQNGGMIQTANKPSDNIYELVLVGLCGRLKHHILLAGLVMSSYLVSLFCWYFPMLIWSYEIYWSVQQTDVCVTQRQREADCCVERKRENVHVLLLLFKVSSHKHTTRMLWHVLFTDCCYSTLFVFHCVCVRVWESLCVRIDQHISSDLKGFLAKSWVTQICRDRGPLFISDLG